MCLAKTILCFVVATAAKHCAKRSATMVTGQTRHCSVHGMDAQERLLETLLWHKQFDMCSPEEPQQASTTTALFHGNSGSRQVWKQRVNLDRWGLKCMLAKRKSCSSCHVEPLSHDSRLSWVISFWRYPGCLFVWYLGRPHSSNKLFPELGQPAWEQAPVLSPSALTSHCHQSSPTAWVPFAVYPPLVCSTRVRVWCAVNLLNTAQAGAKSSLWWPFTQHSTVLKEDVSVIDSRRGESFAVYQQGKGEGARAGAGLQMQYDGCASWWTQVEHTSLLYLLCQHCYDIDVY